MSFNTKPPRDDGPKPRALWRAKAGKTLGAVILSKETTGVGTHFHQGRTVLCEDKGCELCTLYGPSRWYGFWACYHGRGKPLTIFQFTLGVWDTVHEWQQNHLSLRGTEFAVTRANQRHNSRLLLQMKGVVPDVSDLPKTFNVEETLRKIWKIAPKKEQEKPDGKLYALVRDQEREARNNGRHALNDSKLAGVESDR